ncbi:ferrochelatase [Lactobacillus pentosus]|jgi:ferrochelatase|uniref:Coproporphyrin III ferrochelatase n=1 Tax=Lactiplantibacillus pentosus TaxID=1589 RepID=A0AB37RDB7_LACPE|nr:ferrochelatase [Lactiplantibacillus pentosus]MCH4130188.1 ferrochelatase [Lactiplantibacillus sp.]BBM20500.1 ferrochelatase [Lactiplantibacillus plantarum]MCT3293101.1 ferrochelatase [Lactiplantibacillus pentosus]MPQ20836.1 ferrochelatase [Lactiplantibacillus pentosus]RMW41216.1 ferrochelatase [Lactiplantibacillus pentosus]
MHPGLLLVNLGSPASPTTQDVKTYLQEFLSDPSVIEMPAALWQPLLRGIILPTRSWRSATFYQDSWLPAGSPLIVYSEKICEQVQADLPDWDVRLAMTYGQPDIGETLQAMVADGCEQPIVLPLFPQYTQSTHGGIHRQVEATGLPHTFIDHFYDNATYIQLLAAKVWESYQQHDFDAVIFSYHSIPTAMVRHGDPYQKECEATTAAVLAQLPELPADKVITAYQSKFGPMPWLKPYLRNELMQLVELGKRNVLIATPSFVVDCLETLEEDYVQNYQTFKSSGGDRFELVPPMNTDPQFSQLLADLAVQKWEARAHATT